MAFIRSASRHRAARIFAALLLAGALAAAKTPEPARTASTRECGPVGDVAKQLMTESRLAYLADAIDSDDVVHMWYVSAKTHEWAEIEVDDNLVACIARRGYDWHFAVGR